MNRSHLFRRAQTSLLCVLLIAGLTACHRTVYRQHAGEVFHTTYHIQYNAKEDLLDEIVARLDSINASLSMFNPQSTLSRINQAPAGWVDISDDRLACLLIGKALEISRLTDGAFDMTVAPLVNLWGFGYQKDSQPSRQRIDSIMDFTGYRRIDLDRASGRLYKSDSRCSLDASAIAKGYACDVVAELLESRRIGDYLVEIGGEIRLSGHNAKGEIWKIGIDRPMDDPMAAHRELQSVLQLTGKGMATSGNYRNFYLQGNRKIAHTIDPKSGQPAQSGLLSATVTAPDCLTADALATAFMVMGTEKAARLADSLPDIDAYLIYSDEQGDFQTWCSTPLQDCLKELK